MTDDTDDAKEWVTVKIPKQVRNQARDDPRTYGRIMQAGLEVPSDDLQQYEEFVDTVEQAIHDAQSSVDVTAFEGGMSDDRADEIIATLEGVRSALGTVEERTGRIERTVEDMEGRMR
jgi:hypothetical protein